MENFDSCDEHCCYINSLLAVIYVNKQVSETN
jgi:hypothetical protein